MCDAYGGRLLAPSAARPQRYAEVLCVQSGSGSGKCSCGDAGDVVFPRSCKGMAEEESVLACQ